MLPHRCQPIRACCLYSAHDDDLCREFEVHLSPLVRDGLLNCYYQHRVPPGLDIDEQVEWHLEQAQLIFMLVSPSFVAEQATRVSKSLARARAAPGRLRVIPISCRAIDWEHTALEQVSVSPRNRQALAGLAQRDEGWSAVVADVKAVLRELGARGMRADQPLRSIPGHRSLHFSGRVGLLRELAEALSPTPSLVAVVGMGGVGKTQLVMEHLHHHAPEYDVVLWANAEAKATLAGEFARFAATFDLGGNETPQRVLCWLVEQGRFLLVLDNANSYRDIEDYLPQAGTGHVIVTSRNQDWGAVAHVLRVREFEPAESLLFLSQRTQQKDGQAAAELADELGHLPLALAQAAAYMERTGKSLAEYLALYRRRPRDLRALGAVATTWDLSLAALNASESTRPAVALMNLCAFFSSSSIPVGELSRWTDHVPRSLAACLRDEVKLDALIGHLRGYSLMERSEGMLSVHRLVQAVVADRLAPTARKAWIKAAQRAVYASFVFRAAHAETWAPCSRLLPHALAVTRHADHEGIASDHTAQILSRIGLYLIHRAEFAEAQRALEQAMRFSERKYGPEHPVMVARLTNLADTLREQGLHAQAKQLLRRALTIAQDSYGEDHQLVGCVLNNLSLVLYDLYDRDGARQCLTRALKILRRYASDTSSHLACSLNNFGVLLYFSGELDKARVRLEESRALSLSRPDLMAAIETNLGQIAQEEGDRKEALATYRTALEAVETLHGPMHPRVASILHKRSRIQWELGCLEQAYADCQRALAIAQQVYGARNPAVAGLLETLGEIRYRRGDKMAACQAVEQAVGIFASTFGVNHPRTAEARQVLLVMAQPLQ